jgi:hypothetical protein
MASASMMSSRHWEHVLTSVMTEMPRLERARADRAALELLQISRRFLAALAVVLKLEADLLTFLKVVHSSPLNCGYVDENVLAASVRLNEPESLGRVEPLNSARCHVVIDSYRW